MNNWIILLTMKKYFNNSMLNYLNIFKELKTNNYLENFSGVFLKKT